MIAARSFVAGWHDDCPSVDAMKTACMRYTRSVIPGHVVEEIAAAYRPESRDPWRQVRREGATLN